MTTYESIKDGLAALNQVVADSSKKVAALLTFQHTNRKLCDTCFLFESIENPAAQLVENFSSSLEIVGESRADMSHLVAARGTAINSIVSVVDPDFLGIIEHGHAEEFLIRGFDTACAQISNIGNITIYLSHSPCTIHDRAPSNALTGWPKSCTRKFQQLAANHPTKNFMVCYYKKFGFVQGNNASETTLRGLAGNPANLSFINLGVVTERTA